MPHVLRLINKSFLTATIFYIFFAIIYIHPGEIPFFENSQSAMMSDGTDPATLPYQYGLLLDLAKKDPASLLFGAVYSNKVGAPEGFVFWIPMLERVYVLFLGLFLTPEQIPTGSVLISMILNGLCMFMLGRILKIPSLTSWAMGVAWAFSAYTRGRAQVHMGLVAIYHFPLVFLALLLLAKPNKKSHWTAGLCLLVISFFPQYYVVILACLLPALILFAYLIRPQEEKRHFFLTRPLLFSLPAILWLGFSLFRPIPNNVDMKKSPFPETGKSETAYHPYIDIFSAHPRDYFTGDIAVGPKDLNPIREIINKNLVKKKFEGSNPHERAIGIRWVLWLLSLIALVLLLPRFKDLWSTQDRKIVFYFFGFSFICFWLSLPPGWPLPETGPSLWLHQMISQIRVPNRAGIGVAFSFIIISGLLIKNVLSKVIKNLKFRFLLEGLFTFMIILELPPLYQNMAVAPILPKLTPLTTIQNCGTGLRYPYVSAQEQALEYYYFLQQMRGSSCYLINSPSSSLIDTKMILNFSWPQIVKKELQGEFSKLKSFIDCAKLSWIVFGPPLTIKEAQLMCHSKQWTWHDNGVCINHNETHIKPDLVESCVNLMVIK